MIDIPTGQVEMKQTEGGVYDTDHEDGTIYCITRTAAVAFSTTAETSIWKTDLSTDRQNMVAVGNMLFVTRGNELLSFTAKNE